MSRAKFFQRYSVFHPFRTAQILPVGNEGTSAFCLSDFSLFRFLRSRIFPASGAFEAFDGVAVATTGIRGMIVEG